MNLKLRLTTMDILRLLCGCSVLVCDPYNSTIFRVQKGEDTYVSKE